MPKRSVIIPACGFLLLAAVARGAPWSAPVVVYSSDQMLSRPTVIADPWGGLHVFFTRGPMDHPARAQALMYTRLRAGAWTPPVAVVEAPLDGWVSLAAVTLGADGWFHAVWQGAPQATIYYSHAYVTEAEKPGAWSAPVPLTDRAGAFRSAVRASDGTVHFVCAARTGEVLYRRSDDRGIRWSDPVAIARLSGTSDASDFPFLFVGAGGRLHVTWSQFLLPTGWPPQGGFYSQSVDGGRTWSAPLQVAAADHAQLAVAVRAPGEVHLAWNGIVSNRDRLHQWSRDGGRTWTAPLPIGDEVRGGLTGFPQMATDSSGRLHLVTSADSRRGKHEDVYHLEWDGEQWSPPELLSPSTVGQRSVELPSLAIGEGNHLHVVYEDDFQRIWYVHRRVEAPVIAAAAVPPKKDLPRPLSTEVIVLASAVAVVAGVGLASRRGWLPGK